MDHGVGIGPTWFAFKARLGYQQPAREQNGWKGRGRTYVGRFRGGRPAIRRLFRKLWRAGKESNPTFGPWRPIVPMNTNPKLAESIALEANAIADASRFPSGLSPRLVYSPKWRKADSTIAKPLQVPFVFKTAVAPRLLHFP